MTFMSRGTLFRLNTVANKGTKTIMAILEKLNEKKYAISAKSQSTNIANKQINAQL